MRASFVRHRLRQRHGDLVWQVRFRGGRGGWLYLLLLLEFQSTIEPVMAVRVLTFTSLQRENPTVAGSWSPTTCLPLPSGLVDLNAVGCQIPRDAFVDAPTLLGCASRIIQSRLGMIAGVAGLYRPFRQLGEIRAPNLYLPVLWQEVPERVQVVPERKRYLL